MCYQILLGNATNQEHLQLCSFRTFDGINIWADANHWRLPRFKMSCCTWASFKTLVFVGMLTAKFWAYLNPQSEPQFYNRFLKKLSQCCFLESSRRNAWINQCWCTLLTSLLRKKKKKKKLSEDNTKASQNFIVESWRSYLSVAFSKVSRRNAWINQCWCILLTSLLRKKKKLSGDNSKASQNFIAQSWRSNLFLEISRRNEWINNLWCVLVTSLLLQKNK